MEFWNLAFLCGILFMHQIEPERLNVNVLGSERWSFADERSRPVVDVVVAETDSAQKRCDNRPVRGSPGLMRCFLSSHGGAPLGAQISGVVILGLIAGIGIIAGIGRELGGWVVEGDWRWRSGRLRRYGGLLSCFSALCLFGWWLSAA